MSELKKQATRFVADGYLARPFSGTNFCSLDRWGRECKNRRHELRDFFCKLCGQKKQKIQEIRKIYIARLEVRF